MQKCEITLISWLDGIRMCEWVSDRSCALICLHTEEQTTARSQPTRMNELRIETKWANKKMTNSSTAQCTWQTWRIHFLSSLSLSLAWSKGIRRFLSLFAVFLLVPGSSHSFVAASKQVFCSYSMVASNLFTVCWKIYYLLDPLRDCTLTLTPLCMLARVYARQPRSLSSNIIKYIRRGAQI